MKMSLSRQAIVEIFYVLNELLNEEKSKFNKGFTFAVTRTMDSIKPEVRAIIEARETGVDKYKEYEEKKMELVSKYASKDENGEPVSENSQWTFPSPEVKTKAQEELNAIRGDYEEAIQERAKEIDLYNELAAEEVEIEICQTSFERLPDDLLPYQFEALRPMIKETDEEIEALI